MRKPVADASRAETGTVSALLPLLSYSCGVVKHSALPGVRSAVLGLDVTISRGADEYYSLEP